MNKKTKTAKENKKSRKQNRRARTKEDFHPVIINMSMFCDLNNDNKSFINFLNLFFCLISVYSFLGSRLFLYSFSIRSNFLSLKILCFSYLVVKIINVFILYCVFLLAFLQLLLQNYLCILVVVVLSVFPFL